MEQVNKNNGKESNGGEIAKKILFGVGGILLAFAAYCWFVNSHGFEGNFFGLTIRMPFESVEHYCNRKSEGFLTVDTKAYQECRLENGSQHERLKAKIDAAVRAGGVYPSDKQLECAAKVYEKYLSSDEINTYLSGGKLSSSSVPTSKIADGLKACEGK